jgi:hypothetical protein
MLVRDFIKGKQREGCHQAYYISFCFPLELPPRSLSPSRIVSMGVSVRCVPDHEMSPALEEALVLVDGPSRRLPPLIEMRGPLSAWFCSFSCNQFAKSALLQLALALCGLAAPYGRLEWLNCDLNDPAREAPFVVLSMAIEVFDLFLLATRSSSSSSILGKRRTELTLKYGSFGDSGMGGGGSGTGSGG